MKYNLGLKQRQEVLTNALTIESITSKFLAELLGIKYIENSKTLGNKSGCLSFNQKVDLLIEIGAIPKEEKMKFQKFMEIRNQFMHNIEATSYEKCMSYTDGTEKFLLKTYPTLIKKDKEETLKSICDQLATDILIIISNIIEKLKEKKRTEVEAEVNKISHESFLETINQIKTSLDEQFEEEINKSTTFNTQRLKGFGTQLSKAIFKLWRVNFEKRAKGKLTFPNIKK